MRSRARGALWLLVLVLCGRVLDALDLPFESSPAPLPTGETVADDASRGSTLPRAGERAAVSSEMGKGVAATPLDLQTATVRDLQALPGVGPVLAARIVAFRESHGVIRNLEELQRVQGIGARTAHRLAPMLRFPAAREEKRGDPSSPEP